MHKHKPLGDARALQRPIPKNPKYANVKATLDTGSNVLKVEENYTRGRPRDLFRRIKGRTLARLLCERTGDPFEDLDEMFQAIRLEEKTGSRGTPSRPTLRSGSAVPPRLLQETPRDSSSTCSSPSSSAVSMASSMVSEYLPCVGDNFLLLDTRTEDEYEACHVVGALSYPSAMLARTMNPYIPEIYSFKNREGKIIILYDYEERVASRVGSTLVEQGIDNVYVLSGGLRSFSKYFPTMIKGDPPALSSPSLVSQKHTGKSRQRLSSGSASTSSPGVTHSRIRQSTGTPTRKESLPGVLSHPRS